jgi:alanine racemase
VGVPLSIFAINEKHNMGILKQEFLPLMRWKIEKVIRPTIGILTNIGSSHEGFVDLENKIKEKLILFKDVEILIYQKRDLIDKLIFPNKNIQLEF